MKVNVRCSDGSLLSVNVESDATILNIKEKIHAQLADTPPSAQKIVYKGRILKDEDTLAGLSEFRVPDARCFRGTAVHAITISPGIVF